MTKTLILKYLQILKKLGFEIVSTIVEIVDKLISALKTFLFRLFSSDEQNDTKFSIEK